MTEERCITCGHPEDDHDGYGGLCDGLGWNSSRQICGCIDFRAAPSSVPLPTTEPPEIDLEQAFKLKETIVALRKEIAEASTSFECPYARVSPFDLEAVLNEVDRLLLVNGQIARLWAEAEDRVPALPTGRAAGASEREHEPGCFYGPPLNGRTCTCKSPPWRPASAPVPSLPTDFSKLLDEYAVVAVRASRGRVTSTDLSAARSALQAAFLKLLEERDATEEAIQERITAARAQWEDDGWPFEWVVATALREKLKKSEAEVSRLSQDAQRWQALVTSPRVSVLGGARYHQPGWLLAVEFYDEAPDGIAKAESVQRLIEYADFRAARRIADPEATP